MGMLFTPPVSYKGLVCNGSSGTRVSDDPPFKWVKLEIDEAEGTLCLICTSASGKRQRGPEVGERVRRSGRVERAAVQATGCTAVHKRVALPPRPQKLTLELDQEAR